MCRGCPEIRQKEIQRLKDSIAGSKLAEPFIIFFLSNRTFFKKQRFQFLAAAGEESEGGGGEAGAAVKLEGDEHVGLGAHEHGDVVVGDNHPAEVQHLEEVEGGGELADPGRGGAAPVLGDEVEHGGAGLGLELERLEAGEAAEEAVGGGGVGHGDGDVLAAERVDLAPVAADERDGVAVPGVLHAPHDQPQRHVRDPEAHGPPQVPPVAAHRREPAPDLRPDLRPPRISTGVEGGWGWDEAEGGRAGAWV